MTTETINLTPHYDVIFVRFLNDAIAQLDSATRDALVLQKHFNTKQSLEGFEGSSFAENFKVAQELRNFAVSLNIALQSISSTSELESLRQRLSEAVGKLADQVDSTKSTYDELS